ncbi:hypothetical protein ABVT39_015791 [Epinephelus coioides]
MAATSTQVPHGSTNYCTRVSSSMLNRYTSLEKRRDEVKLNDKEIQGHFISKNVVGHHSFDNTDKKSTNQVAELLEKIDKMVEKNNRGHYTNKMFEMAQNVKDQEMKTVQPNGMTAQDIARKTATVILTGTVGESLGGLVLGAVECVVGKVFELITQ